MMSFFPLLTALCLGRRVLAFPAEVTVTVTTTELREIAPAAVVVDSLSIVTITQVRNFAGSAGVSTSILPTESQFAACTDLDCTITEVIFIPTAAATGRAASTGASSSRSSRPTTTRHTSSHRSSTAFLRSHSSTPALLTGTGIPMDSNATPITSQEAADSAQTRSRKHTQAVVGGVLGTLAAVGVLVAILFMFRRRRLQQEHRRNWRFLSDVETPAPAPMLVPPPPAPAASGESRPEEDEKAVLRRAELQHVEEEMTVALRRLTLQQQQQVPAQGSSATGGEADPLEQLAVLRARVRELELQRRELMVSIGEAPPGYCQQAEV
ncbi:hypothetical protein C8R46DRAFT_484953 [Mycena filopes]|nr:hypothetical protein C8R46DRAFT_484953 [Mycena filopes]